MRRLWVVFAVGVACACGDAFAPGHSRAALNLVPTFSENVYELLSGDLDELHIRVSHIPGGALVLDTTVAVDTAGNVDIDLSVTLSAQTDSFDVLLEGIRSSDNTVLYSGFDTVVVKAGEITPPGDTIRVNYVGPCPQAAKCTVTVAPQDSILSQGDSVTMRVTVLDSLSASVPGVPVSITNLTPGLVAVSATRHVRALTGSPGGVARVVATIHGAADTLRDTIPPSGSPAIGLNPTSATFTTTAGGSDPTPQTVSVTNAGIGTLSGLAVSITYVTGTPGWLAAGLSTTTAPSTLTLTPTLGSLAAGTYTATATVSSTLSGVAPQTVSVTFTVNSGPAIGLASKSKTFSATAGGADPAPQTVNVTNAGGGTLSGLSTATTYTSGSGWLGVSLSTTVAPSVLTLTPTLGVLTPGSYHARVTVSSSLSGVASDTVGVTFTVNAGAPAVVIVTPGYATLRIAATGNTAQLADTVKDGVGNLLSPGVATWTSRTPGVASVSSSGLVTAVARGTAVIVASAGTARDSTLVVVGDTASPGDPLFVTVTNGRAFGQRNVGQFVIVDVVADLKAVLTDSLASYNARYTWDQTVLRFDSTHVDASMYNPGGLVVNSDSTAGGILRFADVDPNGEGGARTLVRIFFTALAAGSDNHLLDITEVSGPAPNYVNFFVLNRFVVASGNAAIAP